MNKYLVSRYKLAVDLTPWWWRVAYLIIPDWNRFDQSLLTGFDRIAQGKDEAFNTLVNTHLMAYLEKGTIPPAAISCAIMNIAEDVIAGRTPTLRAGDYIALQTHRRAAQ